MLFILFAISLIWALFGGTAMAIVGLLSGRPMIALMGCATYFVPFILLRAMDTGGH